MNMSFELWLCPPLWISERPLLNAQLLQIEDQEAILHQLEKKIDDQRHAHVRHAKTVAESAVKLLETLNRANQDFVKKSEPPSQPPSDTAAPRTSAPTQIPASTASQQL
eukprot:m.286550 g.286550  ORF g.286550 m.286550 type:complete len:109 (+) comp54992_c0_seq7:1-327(+)